MEDADKDGDQHQRTVGDKPMGRGGTLLTTCQSRGKEVCNEFALLGCLHDDDTDLGFDPQLAHTHTHTTY